MDFPYYHQETKYTCGAAAMRMALEMVGIRRSEKQVGRLLGTNKVRGTWDKDFPKLAERYRLVYIVDRNASFQDLKEYHKKGFTIIISYRYPTEKMGHYSVLKKIGRKKIYFWDPLFGPNHYYSIYYFRRLWGSDQNYDREKRWFFALKKS